MVGIVAGNGLGLWNAQSNGMGATADSHALGQAGGLANVNVANGNLSIQFLDETLSGMGVDMGALRTYNSLGNMTRASQYLDGDKDNWRWAGERRLILSGTVNQAGSQLIRIADDGHETSFGWNGSYYASTEGDGAHDSIVWDGSEYRWIEGSGGNEDRYLSTGILKNSRDINGNGFDYTFSFNSSLGSYQLTVIKDIRTLESLEFIYGISGNGINKLERIDTRTSGNLLTQQVYYKYDTARRLESVITDLTPGDNSIADNKVYQTKYTYSDSTNFRIATIVQSTNGATSSSAAFTYDVSGRIWKVNDYSGITTFSYTAGITTVTNAAGDTWKYTYDTGTGNSKAQLLKVESASVNGVVQSQSYTYDADGNVKTITDGRNKKVTYDYDINGNRTKEVDDLGNTLTRTFNLTNNTLLTETRYTGVSLTATLPNGPETIRYVYEASNLKRARFVVSAEGRVSETVYNTNGLVYQSRQYAEIFSTSGNLTEAQMIAWVNTNDKTKSQLTEYLYDFRGNLQRTTRYAGVTSSGTGVLDTSAAGLAADVTKFIYNEQGQLLQTIAVRGGARNQETLLSSIGYDGMGRQTSLLSNGATTTTSYSGVSITVANGASGLTVVSTTDTAGRLTSVTSSGDGANRVTKYYYDVAGRLRMSEDPAGARNYVFYDAAGRVNAKVNAVGAATVYTYDADGRVLTETNHSNMANTATWFDGVKVTKNSFNVGLTPADLTPGQASAVATQVDYPVTVNADTGSTNPNMYVNFTKLDSPATSVLKYVFTFYPSGYPGWEDKYIAEYYNQQPRVIIQGNATVNTTYTAKITVIDVYDKVLGETALFTFRGVGGQPQISTPKMTYQKAGPVKEAADIIVNNATNSSSKDRVASYLYDVTGRLQETTVAGLAPIENTYDGESRLVQTKQGSQITKYYYDKDGRQLGVVNAERYLTESIYDGVGRLSKTVRYVGQIADTSGVFATIKAAAVAASVVPVGSDATLSSYYYYDSEGRPVGVVDEQGFLTETVYDAAANTRRTLQYMTPVTPTPSDTLVALRARAGVSEATTTTFDGYGRVDNVITHDGTINRNVYDTAGRLIRQIQGDSINDHTDKRVSLTKYNAFSEVKGVINGMQDQTLAALDAILDPTALSAATTTAITNYGTTFQMDGAGRKIAEFGPVEPGKPQAKTFLYYNPAGQLTYTVNALGEVSQTTYNTFGQVSSIFVYTGRIAVAGLTGGADGAVASLVNAIANSQSDKVLIYTYNQFGKVSSLNQFGKPTPPFNASGAYFTNYTYDANGNLLTEVQDIVYGSSSTKMLYAYDLLGRVKDTTRDADVLKATTRVVYDGFGRITNSFDANNSETKTAYTDSGRSITVTDAMNKTKKIEVDAFGRTVKSYDGSGNGLFTQYTYDDAARKVTVRTPEGVSITTTKTRTGETLQVEDSKGGLTKYTYTKQGKLDTVTDAKGIKITDNDYDNSGRLYQTKSIGADGAVDGLVTRYEYDAANRVIKKIVDADGTLKIETQYAFDGQGRQITVTEALGLPEQTVTQYDYRRDGKIDRIIIDPAGLKLSTSFSYDDMGNTVKVERGTLTNPAQQVTLYTFDQLGRKVLEQQDPNGLNIRTQYKYDLQGNMTRVIDANGNSTWFMYNLSNQKTRQIDALGGVTTFNYDKNAALIQTRQLATPVSTATLLSVDVVPATFALPAEDPANDRRTYTVYDNDNRLKYTLNAMNATEWVVSENVYDLNNNIVELRAYAQTISDTTVVAMSAQAANERSSISATDVANELLKPQYSVNTRITRYGYDANNRQIKTTLPGWYSPTTGQVTSTATAGSFQRTIDVTYDNAGRAVANVISTGPALTDRIYQYKTYDTAGREINDVDGLGYVSQKTYDALGNIKTLTRSATSIGVKTSGYWLNSGVGGIAVQTGRTITYGYDKAGRQIQIKQPVTGSTNFVSGNAVTTVSSATPLIYSSQAITDIKYDDLGNRIKQSSTIDNAGVTADTYAYFDKAGRQTWSVDALGYGTFTEYDALGNVKRTTEYNNPANTGTVGSLTAPPTYSTSSADRIVESDFDALGRAKITRRRVNGNLIQVSNKTFNAFGDVIQSWDAQNNLTQINYNKLGKTTKITEASRLVAGTGVDVFANQVNATPITTMDYDAFGQSTRQTRSTSGGLGATASVNHVFDLAGNEIQTIDALGNSSYMEYDVTGHIIKQKQAISVTNATADINYNHTIERRFEYDVTGRQTATLDVFNGQKSGQVNVYNGYGEVIEERKVWGASTDTTASLMASAINNAMVTSYSYDGAGRVQFKRGADGYTYFYYDLLGSVTRAEQRGISQAYTATTRVTENYYDKAGHQLVQRLPQFQSTVTGALGSATVTMKTPLVVQTVDRWGNVLTRTDAANSNPTTYTYNQDNQLVTETGPSVAALHYNSATFNGSLIHELGYDSLGRVTTDSYKAFGYGASVLSTHTTTNSYNTAGQLTQTLDATGVKQQFAYDASGNRVGTKDGLGHVTVDYFDLNNQLVKHSLIRSGTFNEYTGAQVSPTAITMAAYQYDQAGRKYADGDAGNVLNAPNYQYYQYDERGNITISRNRVGGKKTYTFDELGNKTSENEVSTAFYYTYPNGPYGSPVQQSYNITKELNGWAYKNGSDYADYAGQMAINHRAAGLTYTYSYTGFGQLQSEALAGTTVTYDYWENGQQKSIVESSTASVGSSGYNTAYTTTSNNSSYFYYDIKGNKTAENNATSKSNTAYTVFQPYGGTLNVAANTASTGNLNTYYQYDARNRLVNVSSPATTVSVGGSGYSTTNLAALSYDYDEWGNRRRISSTYTLQGGSQTSRAEWYAYDDANRVTVEAGISTGTAAATYKDGNGKVGVVYAYDGLGRRVKEEIWTNTNVSVAPPPPYGTGIITPLSEGYETKTFSYNDLGLVANVTKRVDTRSVGANSSAAYLTIGAAATIETNSYDNRGFKTQSVSQSADRTNTSTYNLDGTINSQTTSVTSTGRKETMLANYSYDTSGNVTSYQYNGYDTSKSANTQTFYNTYSYSYIDTYSGRQVGGISVSSSQAGTGKGTTTNTYDNRGRLSSAAITEASVSNSNQTGNSYRNFAYNTSGQIISKIEQKFGESGYKTQNYYYFNGGELANLGALSGVDISPLSTVYSGGSTPSSYVVNSGDTLMGIAQSLFGDANLWYLIADANGLHQGPSDAFAVNDIGRNLRIPNSDKSVGNTSSNFKPYNPSEIIGDLTPNPAILPPPKAKGCNAIAMIIMVVVAVVLTVVTAGAAAAAMGPGLASAMAAGAAGSFVGSVGSQLVGMAMGVVEHFSLRQAVSAGIAGGLTAGLGSVLSSGAKGVDAAGNAIRSSNSFVTIADGTSKLTGLGQGIAGAGSVAASAISNKISGLNSNFSWASMAAGFAGGYAQGAMGLNANMDAANGTFNSGKMLGNFAQGFAGGALSATAQRIAGVGGKQNWGQLALDSFGNALGSSIAVKFDLQAMGAGFGKRFRNDQAPAQQVNNQVSWDDIGDDPFGSASSSEIPQSKTDTETKAATQELTSGGTDGAEKAIQSKRIVEKQKSKTEGGLSNYNFDFSDYEDPTIAAKLAEMNSLSFSSGNASQDSYFASAHASNTDYYQAMQDKAVREGSFFSYLAGKAGEASGDLFYSLADTGHALVNNPGGGFTGAAKALTLNFGPETFNFVANTTKTVLNGYSLVLESTPLFEVGAFDGFRSTDAFNFTPVFDYSQSERGGALIGGLAFGFALNKIGSYNVRSPLTIGDSVIQRFGQTGSSGFKLQSPLTSPKVDFGSYLRDLIGPPPQGMTDPHAHHILFKEGNGVAQKALVQEGQSILRGFDIDPIMGKENLVWAPNRVAGQHHIDALTNVVDQLKMVKAVGGTRDDAVMVLQLAGKKAAARK